MTLLTESYPPYNMSVNDKNYARGNDIDGIATDIIREVMKRAGMDYSMTLRFPWSKVYNLTLEKQNYGVFSAARTPERENLFKWVGPVARHNYVIMARNDQNITIRSLKDLKGKKIGSYKDDYVANKLINEGLNVITTLKDNSNAQKLKRGDIDLWATGELSGFYGADQVGVSGLKVVYLVDQKDFYLAINKNTSDAIVNKMQSTLDSMRADGTIDAITNQYR